MRCIEDVLKRFQLQYDKHLKERWDRYLCRSFLNCCFNERHRVKGNGMVGFCACSEVAERSSSKIVVCGDDKTAKDCRFYQCINTKDSVKQDFDHILKDPSRCGQEYPKLAILIWVLQDVEGVEQG